MSANNQVNLVGRWTKEPVVQKTPSNKSRMSCCLAVQKTKEEANFINVVAWNELADNIYKYTHKGSLVAVSGELISRNYEKDGVKKVAYEVNAHDVRFLESKSSSVNTDEIELSREDMPF